MYGFWILVAVVLHDHIENMLLVGIEKGRVSNSYFFSLNLYVKSCETLGKVEENNTKDAHKLYLDYI